MFNFFKKKPLSNKSGFPTITLVNKLITAGAERDFVQAVSAIWFLQANNDPNTKESQKLVGPILGTLENFLVEEAKVTDEDVYKYYIRVISESKYGALIDDTQPIYDAGRKEVTSQFPSNSDSVMDMYSFYANQLINTTKQNKTSVLETLQALAKYVDMMCGLANKAEKKLW